MLQRSIFLAAGLAAATLAAGCLDSAASYHCDAEHTCDPGHLCVGGLCATPDTTCPSLSRWDSSAGAHSGECTAPPDLSVPDPNCGNGVLDPMETCDPGMGSPQPCPTAAECDDHEPCTTDILLPPGDTCHQICVHSYDKLDDGVACPLGDGGVPGTCYKHVCCTGCWNGQTCRSGQNTGACGAAGKLCADCVVDGGGGCLSAACLAGACAPDPSPEGSQCAGGGTCRGGTCCNGCIADGGVCVPGTSLGSCGAMGNSCATCQNGCSPSDGGAGGHCVNCTPTCGMNKCGDDGCGGTCPPGCANNQVCTNGQCVCADVAEKDDNACKDGKDNDCNAKTDCGDTSCNAMRCADARKFCANGNCIDGCRIMGANNTIVIVKDGNANPGNPCQVCNAAVDDSKWTILADKSACSNANMVKGACWNGSCCVGCWDGATCRYNQGTTVCGTHGALCKSCVDGNPCTNDVCDGNAGTCSSQRLQDGAPCSTPTACSNMCVNCGGPCTTGPSCQMGVCDPNKPTRHTCCGLLCCVKNGMSSCLSQCL